MRVCNLHSWDLTPREAADLQTRLAPRIITDGGPTNVRLIAAADVAFVDRPYRRRPTLARAAVVVLPYPDLEIVEQHVMESPVGFPYMPGLLSFREIPVLAQAFELLDRTPDLLLVDGQGRAHPRRFGLACHLGLLLDLPTIGVAKSRLVGEHAEPDPIRGASTPIAHDGELIGTVLRTRDNVKPVYVSIGHRISLESAADWVLRLCTRYRLPEPIRLADRLSKAQHV
jgi:deoxyribonuclease V